MQTSLDNASLHTANISRSTWHWVWIVASGSIIFLALMLFRQTLYPAPWFDEGLFVSMAATISRDGLYALPDSAGARIMDPSINTGPTVLVPVALVFKSFGVGLFQARLTMIFFAALALVSYALLARRLVKPIATALALLLLLIGNRELYASFVPMSRQVLGEVPALSYYLLGVLIWLGAVERQNRYWPGLILSGLAWGIAIVTKFQMILLILGCVSTLALLDHYYYRQLDRWALIVPCTIAILCELAWYTAQIAITGFASLQQHTLGLQSNAATGIIFSLELTHWRNALSVLWSTGWWFWGAPGLAWGIWQARQRTPYSFRHAVVLALPLVNLFWFVLLSVGWGRYAFFTFVLTPIWTAGLLWDIAQNRVVAKNVRWSRAATVMLLILYVGWNGEPLARNLVAPKDSGYLAMNKYLETHVAHDALLESWDWEMSIDAPQPIHHPSASTMFTMIDSFMKRQSPPPDIYDALQAHPQYIMIGPFSSWTGIYREVIAQDTKPVVSFGDYTLYRVVTTGSTMQLQSQFTQAKVLGSCLKSSGAGVAGSQALTLPLSDSF